MSAHAPQTTGIADAPALADGWAMIEADALAKVLGMTREGLLKRCKINWVPVRRFGRAALIRRDEFEAGLRMG